MFVFGGWGGVWFVVKTNQTSQNEAIKRAFIYWSRSGKLGFPYVMKELSSQDDSDFFLFFVFVRKICVFGKGRGLKKKVIKANQT